MGNITAVILTYNEARHLPRCIESVKQVAERICVVDSFSTDETTAIASQLGAEVYQRSWPGHAQQFNWALDNCKITSEWVMRVDADERLEPDLIASIREFIATPEKYNAAVFRRKIVFMGREIKHGFFYPGHIVRLWRFGEGRIEQRLMDEHVAMKEPRQKVLKGDLTDENLNDLSWWTQKHDGYALLEAYEIALSATRSHSDAHLSGRARLKRWTKLTIYNRLPTGTRAFFYFFYRYFIGMGFLDGREGLYFHFLQAFWYRLYVDAKLHELGTIAQREGKTLGQLLIDRGIARPPLDV